MLKILHALKCVVFKNLDIKKGLVNHNVVNVSQGEGFSIWVERMHNSIRRRTHRFRGLHGSVKSAYALMKGQEIFYNFVKKHEALKGLYNLKLLIDG